MVDSPLAGQLKLYDLVRVDHFRGFAGYWEVPYAAETAMIGEWKPAPGHLMFEAVHAALGDLPIIAEDLGVITPDVEALRDDYNLPGMAVLQFAFGGGDFAANAFCRTTSRQTRWSTPAPTTTTPRAAGGRTPTNTSATPSGSTPTATPVRRFSPGRRPDRL